MEPWLTELRLGRSEAAWDRFLDRYRRLIFAAIQHYARDHDDVMDIFARVCEALRENDLHRLRQYADQVDHRARFSTWLITVVRHLTIDWFRHRDGRRRLSGLAGDLPPLRRCIFEQVFFHRRSHVETYEILKSTDLGANLSFRQFLSELRATYEAVTARRRGRVLFELGGPRPPPPEATDSPVDPPPPDPAVAEALALAMKSLAPEDQITVQMYVIDDLPAHEIARILGAPSAKAVYNRVYRALAALRSELQRAGIQRGDV